MHRRLAASMRSASRPACRMRDWDGRVGRAMRACSSRRGGGSRTFRAEVADARRRGAARPGRLRRLVRGAGAHRARPERSAVPVARRGGDHGGDALVPDPGSRGRGRVRRPDGGHPSPPAAASRSSSWRATTGTRWAAAIRRACTARCSRSCRTRSGWTPQRRDDGVGVAGAGQYDGRACLQPALCVPLGGRAGRDRADRAGPRQAGGRRV